MLPNRSIPTFAEYIATGIRWSVSWYRSRIDQEIHILCLNLKQEKLRGDYHGYVCKDTTGVLLWVSVDQWISTTHDSVTLRIRGMLLSLMYTIEPRGFRPTDPKPKNPAISGISGKSKKNMAPRPGLEPGTCGLTGLISHCFYWFYYRQCSPKHTNNRQICHVLFL
jgi:hypothetical protein